jgi:hypothetical protein
MELEVHVTSPTVTAIFEHYEAEVTRKGSHRPHLGASQIGNPCSRALWYQFRHAHSPHYPGRILRLFETGNREEARIIANLRAVGVTVWDRDPATGRQISFSDFGGHFSLSLDGVGVGLKESNAPHTLEFKTMGEKAFKAVVADGVQKSKPVYWAQCQVGMLKADLDRCAFIAVNKNTDEIYMERIHLDKVEAQGLLDKAEAIIFSEQPPAKISNDPSFFGCKFCDYFDVCHGNMPPEVNCRTCAHATPERDGTWSCAADHAFGVVCAEHLFNPYAMPWPVSDAGADFVEYTDQHGEVILNKGNSADIKQNWIPF